MKEKTLYRSCKNRILGGVAAGLGEYFDIDPTLIRLLFVISVIPGGLGVIIYLASWLIVPNDPKCQDHKKPEEEIKEAANDFAKQAKENFKDTKHGDGRAILGFIIMAIGALLLIKNLTGIDVWANFWPIALIIVGLALLIKSAKRENK